ncbi:MAG TPA: hypothetical protein PLD23_01575 [Armatimonadota bacterium]|nr:hypothetical protein [Armatimonadota bacterium]
MRAHDRVVIVVAVAGALITCSSCKRQPVGAPPAGKSPPQAKGFSMPEMPAAPKVADEEVRKLGIPVFAGAVGMGTRKIADDTNISLLVEKGIAEVDAWYAKELKDWKRVEDAGETFKSVVYTSPDTLSIVSLMASPSVPGRTSIRLVRREPHQAQ